MPSSRTSVAGRALLCALLVLAALAGPASAETKTGLATDPTGDGPTPGRDLTGVRIHWDSAGSLAVTAAFAGPVSEQDRAQLTANARASVDRTCLLESQDTYLLLSGYTGPASGDDRGFAIGSPGWLSLDTQRVRDDEGRTVTLFLDDPRVGEYDLGCVDVRLSADGAQIDGLPPVFFGDGIDGDSDGVQDNRDACPALAGSGADGCPTAAESTGTGTNLTPLPKERRPPPGSRIQSSSRRCIVPDVRRMSLAKARRRLVRAGCRLGRVTRRGRARAKGAWIVRRQRSKPGARHVVGTRVGVVVRRSRGRRS